MDRDIAALLMKLVKGVIDNRRPLINQSWTLQKAWGSADDDVQIEGWLCTPDVDMQHMIVEPEAFTTSLDGYFERRAPLSYVHNDKTLPAGHLQKAAIVRDGKVLKTATHPTDPAEFEAFPESGSGVWVRGVVNDAVVGRAIRKGNVGSFSWTGMGKLYDPLPNGVRRFTRVDPLIESTVAPYPINTKAVIRLAKAYGLEEMEHMEELEKLLKDLAAKLDAKDAQLQKGLTEDAVKALLAEQATQYEEKLAKAVQDAIANTEERLTKAFERMPGVGRAVETPAAPTAREQFEADPAAYLLQKALKNEELDAEEKAVVFGMTKHALLNGLKD